MNIQYNNIGTENVIKPIEQATIIKNLEIAKRILSNLNTPLDGMMRIHIGQIISEAIDALKIEEKHNEDN